jgi:hypothetical protein
MIMIMFPVDDAVYAYEYMAETQNQKRPSCHFNHDRLA